MNPDKLHSRRDFIANCSRVGSAAMISAMAQLRMLAAVTSNASSGSAPARVSGLSQDYRALVCIFLSGGNDGNNMIIPVDSPLYDAYASNAGRGPLALPRTQLLPITTKTGDGRAWALHPSMNADIRTDNGVGLKALYDEGRVAFLANVGTLVVPTTRAQYLSRSVPLPAQLFSHIDQQGEWQSGVPDNPYAQGWGGRLADIVNAVNNNNSFSMSISLDGQNSFQVGRLVTQFSVDPNGIISLQSSKGSDLGGGNIPSIRTRAQSEILGASYSNLFESLYADSMAKAIATSELLSGILDSEAPLNTEFPNTSLGRQLKMIARLIAIAPKLGLRKQIFFARVGGWDVHASQLYTHAGLLGGISKGIAAFYNATVEMGCSNLVTTFTASDFGRTFTSNGDGSDHGWGSHHIIVGGAVKGGDIYGQMPDLTVGGPDDTTRGRWIPTTSVDEYSATLAKWFGVSSRDLPLVLPNIARFPRPDIGFMSSTA